MIKGISVCIIAKNEEKNISTCLERIRKHIVSDSHDTEVIVLDTGSTDDTVKISESFGAVVYHFDWINDFSAARNAAMEKAKYDRILFLDADEFVENADIKELVRLGEMYPDAIGRIERRNLCNSGENTTCIMTDRVERFFDRTHFHYEGCIHEQVVKNDKSSLAGYPVPLQVYHEGYMGTAEQLKNKAIRNNVLLYKELEMHPDDAYVYYQLGQSYSLIGDKDKEYEAYQKGYQLNPDRKAEYTGIMIKNFGMLKLEREDRSDVIDYIKAESDYFMDYADFLCFAGYAYMKFSMFEESLNMYRQATEASLCHLEGNDSYRAYHNMACIYEALGDELKAAEYYKKAGDFEESKKKYSKLLERKADFQNKKVSIILSINNTLPDCINKLLKSLENQSVGMGHMEIIIPVYTSDENVKNILSAFENKYTESVMLLDISDIAGRSSDSFKMELDSIFAALSYVGTDKILFMNEDIIPAFDGVRLITVCMDKTGSDMVSCDVHYGDAGDFVLTIESEEKRHVVGELGIFDNKKRLRMYEKGFLFASGASVEEIIKGECEQKYAGKIFCIRDSYTICS